MWWLNLIPFGKRIAVNLVIKILDEGVQWFTENYPDGYPLEVIEAVKWFVENVAKKWITERV